MKKMQKILIGLAGLVGVMSATTAAATELTSGPNRITALACTQLANDIDIILSANVVGGIDCTTDTTVIGVSVCHQTGLTASRSVTGQAKVGAGATAACVTGLTENASGTCDGIITGAAVPTATTAQGTVSSRYPGVTCDAATADGEATLAVQEATAG